MDDSRKFRNIGVTDSHKTYFEKCWTSKVPSATRSRGGGADSLSTGGGSGSRLGETDRRTPSTVVSESILPARVHKQSQWDSVRSRTLGGRWTLELPVVLARVDPPPIELPTPECLCCSFMHISWRDHDRHNPSDKNPWHSGSA